MEILAGEIKTNELSKNAFGGSELMTRKLAEVVDPILLKECQIISTRVRELDPEKIRILWIHDLPNDPECEHLKNGGWAKFHKIVFVSNWQMQQFVFGYKIPWNKCIVMLNAIDPLEARPASNPDDDLINLIYHTTPHRGLELLVPVFEKLAETYNVHLDVCSSFKAYGWAERDKPFEKLFEQITNHPKMTYHSYLPNDQVRTMLLNNHIFAYPSIWFETSCISLMEAMSAGLYCVHPNLGALYETAANWTTMYQWNDNQKEHANMFYQMLEFTIQDILKNRDPLHLKAQKSYADTFYNWIGRKIQWEHLIQSLLDQPREIQKAGMIFSYTTPGG